MANSIHASVPQRLLPMQEWTPGYRRDWLGIVGVPSIMGLVAEPLFQETPP